MDKQKALEAALGQIEKAFGKGSVMRLGQRESVSDVSSISTGSLGLESLSGLGGYPKVELLKFMVRKAQERQPWLSMWLRKRKKQAAPALLWMRSMLLIRFMPVN